MDNEETSLLWMQGCSEITNWDNSELFKRFLSTYRVLKLRNISKVLYELTALLFLLNYPKFSVTEILTCISFLTCFFHYSFMKQTVPEL